MDARKGIASRDAAFDSAVAAAVSARDAVDRIHGDSGVLDSVDVGHDVTRTGPHLTEFWKALEQDARFLDEEAGQDGDWIEVIVRLTEGELWPNGIPVWAGRQWADFKDDLPEAEGWSDWVDWYEARLTGGRVDAATEFDRVALSNAKRRHVPGQGREPNGEKRNDRRALSAARGESARWLSPAGSRRRFPSCLSVYMAFPFTKLCLAQ